MSPYPKSKNAVRRVESYLKQMVDSSQQLVFASENPTKLARLIFEGIHAAQFHLKDNIQYQEFSTLGAKFKIKVLELKIQCEPRDSSILTGSQKLSSTVLHKLTTVLQIIGAVIQQKQPIMEFPDAKSLPILELQRLSNYATSQGYIMIVSEQDGIMLTKDQESRSLEWKAS